MENKFCLNQYSNWGKINLKNAYTKIKKEKKKLNQHPL